MRPDGISLGITSKARSRPHQKALETEVGVGGNSDSPETASAGRERSCSFGRVEIGPLSVQIKPENFHTNKKQSGIQNLDFRKRNCLNI